MLNKNNDKSNDNNHHHHHNHDYYYHHYNIIIINLSQLLAFSTLSYLLILVIYLQTCLQKLDRITDSQYNIKLSRKDEVCSIENSTDKTKV